MGAAGSLAALPDTIDVDTAKKICGNLWNQEKWDTFVEPVTREQFLALVKGDEALVKKNETRTEEAAASEEDETAKAPLVAKTEEKSVEGSKGTTSTGERLVDGLPATISTSNSYPCSIRSALATSPGSLLELPSTLLNEVLTQAGDSKAVSNLAVATSKTATSALKESGDASLTSTVENAIQDTEKEFENRAIFYPKPSKKKKKKKKKGQEDALSSIPENFVEKIGPMGKGMYDPSPSLTFNNLIPYDHSTGKGELLHYMTTWGGGWDGNKQGKPCGVFEVWAGGVEPHCTMVYRSMEISKRGKVGMNVSATTWYGSYETMKFHIFATPSVERYGTVKDRNSESMWKMNLDKSKWMVLKEEEDEQAFEPKINKRAQEALGSSFICRDNGRRLRVGGGGWDDDEDGIYMDLVGVPKEYDLMKDARLKKIVCSLMRVEDEE